MRDEMIKKNVGVYFLAKNVRRNTIKVVHISSYIDTCRKQKLRQITRFDRIYRPLLNAPAFWHDSGVSHLRGESQNFRSGVSQVLARLRQT